MEISEQGSAKWKPLGPQTGDSMLTDILVFGEVAVEG